MHQPTDRIAHTMAFVIPVVEHWLEREIAQWVHPMNDRSNDPFYLWLYGVEHIVKDHLESKKVNQLPPLHGLLFPISSKGAFICTNQQTVVEHWLK